tara:strand:+ start:958 stop:1119 length:162 start_codon:yes stop_codon:yes gene_type:complete
MDIDEVRCEISSMMDTLQKQLDYLDEIFEAEEKRIQEQQNCWCKFLNRIFKRN